MPRRKPWIYGAVGRIGSGGPSLPTPVLTWVSDETDNTPEVEINIDTGVVEGDDTVDVQFSQDINFGSGVTTYTYTVTAADELDLTLEVTGVSTLANGLTYARGRVYRAAVPITNWSNTDSKTLVLVPSAFTIGMWSVADLATSGDIRVTVASLPTNNGSAITAIEYRIDGGTATNSGISSTGTFDIAGLSDGVEVDIELRAVNAIGNGPWSDVKAVTPTSGYTEVGVVFDGSNDYMSKGANLTGVTDGRKALIFASLTFTSVSAGVTHILGGGDYVSFILFRDGSGKICFNGYTPADTLAFFITGATTIGAERCNILVSINEDGTSRLYIQAAAATSNVWTQDGTAAGGGEDIDFAAGGVGLMAQFDSGNKTAGTVYRIAGLFNPASLPDITNAGVRANFTDASTGVTVDPAVSVAAYGTFHLDMYGAAAVWNAGTNHGSGGNLTMNGSVA